MTDAELKLPVRLSRILATEEAIYGLILVSGMIVVSNSLVGTSANALISVVITVLVFFAAHVYAGTLARMALGQGKVPLGASFRAAAGHSQGMLLVAVVPITILALGISRVVDDEAAIWGALIADTLMLAGLGWFAVARWAPSIWTKLGSAAITAVFGLVLVLLKVLIHH